MRTCPQLRTLFNPRNVPEPLDLSNHHSHRRLPHHLKCISSQGFLDDYDWVYNRWRLKTRRLAFSPIFWYFCPSLINPKLCTNYVEPGIKPPKYLELSLHICNQTTTSLQDTSDTTLTCPTMPTLLTLVLIPHSFQTQLYRHKRQWGWLIENRCIQTNIFIC